jgi:hypothetical protein
MDKPNEPPTATWSLGVDSNSTKFVVVTMFVVSLVFLIGALIALNATKISTEQAHRDRCAAMGQAPATLWPAAWICVPVEGK